MPPVGPDFLVSLIINAMLWPWVFSAIDHYISDEHWWKTALQFAASAAAVLAWLLLAFLIFHWVAKRWPQDEP